MARPSSPTSAAPQPRARLVLAIGLALSAALLLTLIFWRPLWTGGGLVGSDIYAYYLPQKAYYARELRAGGLPLWNNQIGNGYPQVAESQTGVFYPPNLALYGLLDLNAAYSASVLLHYALAFAFTWMYAREIGLKAVGAALAALVYTYGWFPPRICLEWAIVGGAWMPLALWCVERFLATRFWRYAFGLAVTLAVQMLAGHFLLAFITQLVLVGYMPLRLRLKNAVVLSSSGAPSGTLKERSQDDAPLTPPAHRGESKPLRAGGALLLALVVAFPLAAIQLLPTWELKRISQRQGVTEEHDPGYGYIPPKYLSQIALPWIWYADEASFNQTVTPGGSRTNRVEAHLYFGMIPLALLLWRVGRWRQTGDRRLWVWLVLGLAALVYTPGWLLPVTKHLPGFSFFEGPGRFGVVTTLAAGLLAGSGCDDLFNCLESFSRRLARAFALGRTAEALAPKLTLVLRCSIALAVFAGTIADLFVVSRLVTFALLVETPPIDYLSASPLKRLFAEMPQPARIFSEGKNLPSLLGVATVPTYLGLGPAQYFDPAFMLPQPWPFATPPSRQQLDWFHRHGVTHFLAFAPADAQAWPAKLVWEGIDPFINAAMSRPQSAPLFLYELEGSRGRVAMDAAAPGPSARIADYGANRVAIDADGPASGRLILTDLAFPGWQVTVDDAPGEPATVEGMFRGVDLTPGNHRVVWTYRPGALYWGSGITILASLILLGVAHVRYWHPWIFEGRISGGE
jgi:hypothetical protein